jgi:hypothetical protein
MGEFTRRVQTDRVAGPLRRGFTPNGWLAAFAAAGVADEDDQRIYDAALVVHAKLQTIRSRLKLSSSPQLAATTKLRAFVAAANHNFLLARTKSRDAFQVAGAARSEQDPDGFRFEELAAQVKLELKGGFEWSLDEIVESLVDGIEVPVRFALQATPDLAGNPRMQQVEWNDIALELNLGIMFRFAEDVWDDCLWSEYKVIERGQFKAFVPGDVDAKRGQSIGIARRLSLSMGYSVMATKFHRSMTARGLLPRIREVRAVERDGKRQIIKLSKPGESTRAFEELVVMRGYANEPYYSELLQEDLPSLRGLTLSVVLDAWAVISHAALVLMESRQEEAQAVKPDSPAHTWLPKYVPVLHGDALVHALSAAAGIRPTDGRRLIEFFTFRGQAGQEIWAQPLVPVGPTTLAPVFAAVHSPNLRRLVDVWMRQAGIDLGQRGPAFETHVRVSVQESIASSKLLAGHAVCIEGDYTFKPTGGRDEQIDLIFVIGRTVFLAESKCILEPTEPKGVAMHRRTVLKAAEQASRKSQALKDNRTQFIADVKRFNVDLPLDFDVVPLVVVSTATHVGVSAAGVPVIDEYILEKFLEGELEDVAVTGEAFDVVKTVKTIFYTDAADAEAKASKYFASPPQVQQLLNGLVTRCVPLYAVNDQDWEGVVVTFDCVPSKSGPADASIPSASATAA